MNKKVKAAFTSIAIGLAIGIVISGSYLSFKLVLHERLPQNTIVHGLDLSLHTQNEALRKLNKQIKADISAPIQLTLNEETKEASLKDLGLEVLTKETLGLVTPLQAATASIVDVFPKEENNEVQLLKKVDQEKLENKINELFNLTDKLPTPATFALQRQKLIINAGTDGTVIDYQQLKNDLLANNQEIQIIAQSGPHKINHDYLAAHKQEVSNKLTHAFTLEDPVYTDGWTINLIRNPEWVIFNETEIEINKEAFNKYIDEEISKWLDKPVQEVKIFKNEEGEITIEGKGHDGSKILRDRLLKSVTLAVEHKSKKVPIPIEVLTPKLSISQELQDLGIKERISVGHTSYYGSPNNRVHNIKTGTQRFNAKMIAPNETISFNKTLGPVDGRTGYRKELVIKPEGTIPEYGGGICQVSTTMYRAALLSGISIAERNQHSYAVSYYSQILGHGLDATIYLGGADLKLTNDSQNHIIMQAYVENDYELYFIFYGTSEKQVELEGPYISNHKKPGPTVYEPTTELAAGQTKQVEKPHTGFDAIWYRHITDQSGETTKEQINTRYKAVPAKILVGE